MSRTFYSTLRYSTLILFVFFSSVISAQQYHVMSRMPAQHMIDRADILGDIPLNFHSAVRPYFRMDIANLLVEMDSLGNYHGLNSDEIQYLVNDNAEYFRNNRSNLSLQESEKPFLKSFYKSPANFYELYTPDFEFIINPILQLDVQPSMNDDGLYFNNLRGLELRGSLDQRLHFYFNLLEEQSRFPNFIRNWIEDFRAVPGAGFYKDHQSKIFDQVGAHDYLRAEGYLGYELTKHFGIKLGYGNHFIGDGVRSLFLSDFANNFTYLKFNTRVWKLHYENIFAELSPIGARDDDGDNLLPKKYMAAHYLSFRPNPSLSIGVFETVVFSRENTFEFHYLNPIILYRTVEQAIGSPDNVLLGVNLKWRPVLGIALYGQLLMDEFKLSEIFGGDNWWGNKFGVQLGAKYMDVLGIDHLDAQVEFNRVRPYTYAHRDTFSHYAHYNQSLAHPLGANFSEYIFKLRYQPTLKWVFEGRISAMSYGEDQNGQNFGKNVLLSNNDRTSEYGIEHKQGVLTDVIYASLNVSFMIKHNVFVDLEMVYRDLSADVISLNQETQYVGIGLRANVARKPIVF